MIIYSNSSDGTIGKDDIKTDEELFAVLKFYDDLSEKHPRSHTSARLPLELAKGKPKREKKNFDQRKYICSNKDENDIN